ncbi:type I methionyl aminopeptidase [candidate division WWE3 bacterium]|uniref:Methionine aminopeptidase n=1 Tax=candidate division WWE3 bacterium TaxID=2053526 RepID=A0A7X9E7S4_UNCKA|nr:type I methionyl aminopeptidase [candidate division WWE3 bacterium]
MNKISIKTDKEKETMRKAGKILAEMLLELKNNIRSGVDVWELEEKFIQMCKENNVTPSCKGYDSDGFLPPFPTGLCLSINNQSVHCYPKKGVILKNGDIVNIDTVINLEGLHVDSSVCIPVGDVSKDAKDLIETTKKALYEAASKVKHGVRVGVLSETIQKTVEKAGFNVLKDYAGHGIGYSMHEEPEIVCYGNKHEGPKLKDGMTICIETLVCTGNDEVFNVNAWETRMKDGGLFCIFEHTILVTRKGYEILTR